jgi:hypothetical protein
VRERRREKERESVCGEIPYVCYDHSMLQASMEEEPTAAEDNESDSAPPQVRQKMKEERSKGNEPRKGTVGERVCDRERVCVKRKQWERERESVCVCVCFR